ncbi:hypothetical protein [Mycoplasma simbae]|uniref:hypothetical protein n=1 Tax=Mycoplasma simbae TaxID=36744 RepID=UPI00049575DA|nr:hypothetical protein [Mycoplasma simbae]
MGRKKNIISVLTVVASVATTTALALNLSACANNNSRNIVYPHFDQVDLINKVLIKDLKEIDANKKISESDKSKYEKDLATAKSIYANNSSARSAVAKKSEEKLNTLSANISELENKLNSNNEKDELIDLSELEQKINLQTKKLANSIENVEFASVFNKSEHIIASYIEKLTPLVEKTNNQETKDKFNNLVNLNSLNKSKSLSKVKDTLKNKISDLDLFSRKNKDILLSNIENSILPEQALELFFDAENINDLKQSIKNDIAENNLLNNSEKQILEQNLISSDDLDSILNLQKSFFAKVKSKSDAINKIYIINLFTNEKKEEYKNQVIETGVNVIEDAVIPDYKARLKAINSILSLDIPYSAYKNNLVDKIYSATNETEFEQIITDARAISEKLKEVIKQLQSHPSINKLEVDSELYTVADGREDSVDYILNNKIPRSIESERKINELILELRNLGMNEQEREAIIRFWYSAFNESKAKENLSHLLNQIYTVKSEITNASRGVNEEKKALLLSKFKSAYTLNDVEEINFELKTMKERDHAKSRVDNTSRLSSEQKQKIKEEIDNTNNFYEIVIAERKATSDYIYPSELARARAQSQISQMEYLSRYFKTEVNGYLYTTNSEEAIQTKLDELIQLNEAKKQEWARLNVNVDNFNSYVWKFKKFKFNDARTEEEFNNVITEILEQNSKVEQFSSQLDKLTYLSEEFKNELIFQALNAATPASIDSLLEQAKDINTNFLYNVEEIQSREYTTKEQNQEDIDKISAAKSLVNLRETYNAITLDYNKIKTLAFLNDAEVNIPDEIKTQFNYVLSNTNTVSRSWQSSELAESFVYLFTSLKNGLEKLTTNASSQSVVNKYKDIIESKAILYQIDTIDAFVESKLKLIAQKNDLITQISSSVLSANAKTTLINEIKQIDTENGLNKLGTRFKQLQKFNIQFKELINNSSYLSDEQKAHFNSELEQITNLYNFIKLERKLLNQE